MIKSFKHFYSIFVVLFLFLIIISSSLAIDSKNMNLVGRYGGRFNGITVQGNYTYILDDHGLTILNTSNPAHPVKTGSILLDVQINSMMNLVVSGNYAYIASGKASLYIVDISNPAYPVLAKDYLTPGLVYKVIIQNHYAYLSISTALQVLDISNPSEPVFVGSYDTTVSNLAINSTLACVWVSNTTLHMLDISTPAQPHYLGSFYSKSSYLYGMKLTDKFLYTAALYGHLEIFDISTPANTVEVTQYNTNEAYSYSWDLDVQGNIVYLADNRYLHVIDVTTASQPYLVSSFTTGYSGQTVNIDGVVFQDNKLYVKGIVTGMAVIDVSTASQPNLLGQYLTLNEEWSITVDGNYAYIPDALNGLKIFDITTASNPLLIGYASSPDTLMDVSKSGNFLVGADGDAGLVIYDITTISCPTLVGSSFSMDFSSGVAAKDNFAYLADGTGGLRIFDFTTASSPSLVTTFKVPGSAEDVTIDGNYAYLASGSGVYILDITNPYSIVSVSSFKVPYQVMEVVVKGHYVYVADNYAFLIYDISTVTAPLQVCRYNVGCNQVAIRGHYAFLGDPYSAIRVVDILNPALPVEVGHYNVNAYGVAVDSNYIYVAGAANFWILQFTPEVPSMAKLPNLKLFKNQNLAPAFDLQDFNTDGTATTFSIISNFLALSTLTSSTVYQAGYGLATSGINFYQAFNINTSNIINNKVKYSTYKINKLPKIGMNKNSTLDFLLGRFVSDSTGPVIPPSFGNSEAVEFGNSGMVNASWLGNTGLRIQALSTFTAPTYIDVIASPNSNPPFGVDLDKERIWVYPNMLAKSTFSTAQDTTSYAYQQPPDKSVAPSISYYSAMTDKAGEIANGVAKYSFSTSAAGTKATLQFANHLSYESTKWYTARMRIFSPDVNNTHQTLLYNYGGVVGRDPHIDIGAYILFGTPTVWTWMECPLLTFEKSSGYVQFFLKAGNPGSICIDELQIIEATPTLVDANRGPIRLKYPYGDFDVATDTMGWGRQNYPNAVNSYSVVSGQLWVDFSGASSSFIKGIKWTANNASPGVYTPTTQINREVGIKGKIQKISGNFNSYSSIFLLGAYGVQSSGQGQIAIPMSDLLASAEFGRLTDGVHYVVGKSINAYHQFQFAVKNDQNGILAIDDVDFLRDQDDPNYGDSNLFP